MSARTGGISLSNLVTVHSRLLVMVVVLVLLDRMVMLLLGINTSCVDRKLSLLSSPTVKDRPPSGCCTTRVAIITLLLLLLLLLHHVVLVVIGSLLLMSFSFCHGVGHSDVIVNVFCIIVTSKAHFECVISLTLEHDRAHVVSWGHVGVCGHVGAGTTLTAYVNRVTEIPASCAVADVVVGVFGVGVVVVVGYGGVLSRGGDNVVRWG